MSFIKKTLASFGVGSARVDSILQQEFLVPGETVPVAIEVYGGATAQDIDTIELKLCCQYIDEEFENKEGDRHGRKRKVKRTFTLARWTLPNAFTIQPGEQRNFQAEIEVPWNTPVTISDAKVWLETGLDISMAVDPTDKDILTVRPDPLADGVLSALEEEGLRIRRVECEACDGFPMPFVQAFEFVPTTGPFHGRWRELEIITFRHGERLDIWFEIDRQKQGMTGLLSGLLGTGKLHRQLPIPADTAPDKAGKMVLEYLDACE
ncbi:sporulation control protein Spo0M [Vibrio albus]|uniref:Sporulation control protein Spo0M n=1 Tax=Vibrio albus TaxID=2200953 RepID=A0A2U3B4U9_9VIBR|nr:sporulation protein [Vibrio albus]PWI31821.1 sporulation control protein Spo0M [Vibrio albus]